MSELFAPTIVDQIIEVQREIEMRRAAYPRWVASKRITQATADRQLEVLRAALRTLQEVAGREPAN